jgi:transposase-like protein
MARPDIARPLTECATIVAFALTPGERIATAATKFDVHPSTIYYWMRNPKILDLVDPALLANHKVTAKHKPGSGAPKPKPPPEPVAHVDPRPKPTDGKRRTWTDGQKLAVLKEVVADGEAAVLKRHSLAQSQLRRWQRGLLEGKRDVTHLRKPGAAMGRPKANGAEAAPQLPRGLSHRHEAYIQLRRWYDARLKWIRSGGVPGTHDVYAELALRALEGNK